jgi:hypothetical protein
MEPSLFSDEDEWEAEMEDELKDPFEVDWEEPMTPEGVLKQSIEDFIFCTRETAAMEATTLYVKKIDRLQNEISIHLSEKSSLADTIAAMESHIRYLEQRLLGKE